jgi:hypothetical protein
VHKRYVVRLTDVERGRLQALVRHDWAHARKLLYGAAFLNELVLALQYIELPTVR